ncbi:MAG: response regulator transcription factor [Puniceicoccaceae bacterium]
MDNAADHREAFLNLEKEILTLHAAIDQDSLWQSVLQLLKKALPVHRVTLFLGHLGLAEARLVFTDPHIGFDDEWYRERARINPFSPFIEKHIGRSHYHFHEVVGPPAVFKKTDFYKRFARAEGWDKGLSFMFWSDSGMRAMFSLYRSPEQQEFSEEEQDFVMTLSRHIEIAVIRVQKINREESFRTALQAFTRNIPAPVMLIGWSMQPVFVNLAAYESAAVWNLGRKKANSLNPRECFYIPKAVTKAIIGLKAQFTGSHDGIDRKALPEPITMKHPSIPGLLTTVSPVHYSPAMLARPGFIVLFREPIQHEVSSEPKQRIRERMMQQLTPAERKVVEQVCLGKRNDQIAEFLSKSVLTVKTQLNSVFQKLNISSRAELITRMR